MASILIVDDDIGVRLTLQEVLSNAGYEATALITAEDALRYLQTYDPDLILLDLNLPGMHGFIFLEQLKKFTNPPPVIVITSNTDASSAVKAMKLGAYDYITKPFDLDEIILVVQRIVTNHHQAEHLAYLRSKNQNQAEEQIIGKSPIMRPVFEFIQQVAKAPKTTVLIRGETGTGKELVARAIHYHSARNNKPFVDINCSAFQETLLEAELFGYEPGAFTDAKRRKKGLLELAHQGTFFLDEIGDMPTGLQAKILRVMERQTFRRLGGTDEIQVDTRIISATSRNLEELIQKRSFREDLFYRLNVATIELPPLRNRGEDVLLLADYYLRLYNQEFKKNIHGFSDEVIQLMLNYPWPGNVRELRNTIEKAVLFETADLISARFFKLIATESASNGLLNLTKLTIPPEGIDIAMVEKALLENALIMANGNQTRAAKLLKISRETLKYRLRKYHIDSEQYKAFQAS
jgi:DNA-binding NtrC family response regulator